MTLPTHSIKNMLSYSPKIEDIGVTVNFSQVSLSFKPFKQTRHSDLWKSCAFFYSKLNCF